MNAAELAAVQQHLEALYLKPGAGDPKPTFAHVQRALIQLERSRERARLSERDAATIRFALSDPFGRKAMENLEASAACGSLSEYDYLQILQTLLFLLEVI